MQKPNEKLEWPLAYVEHAGPEGSTSFILKLRYRNIKNPKIVNNTYEKMLNDQAVSAMCVIENQVDPSFVLKDDDTKEAWGTVVFTGGSVVRYLDVDKNELGRYTIPPESIIRKGTLVIPAVKLWMTSKKKLAPKVREIMVVCHTIELSKDRDSKDNKEI